MSGKEKMMILKLTASALAIFIAIVFHEIAHGLTAKYFGDKTAQAAGRLSLNPLKHIDPFGTIILPALLFLSKTGLIFGWAKPVPVDYSNLKPKKWGLFAVSSAGIITNLLLAAVSSVLLKLSLFIPWQTLSGILSWFWLQMILFNVILAVFNLLPIPPLDGSKILLGWSDNPKIQKFLNADRQGLLIIVFLAFILPALLQFFHIRFNPFDDYLRETSLWIFKGLILI